MPSNDLINPDLGNNANYYHYYDYDVDFTIGSPYWRTKVGEFELSESPYGTFDQGGNVYEWTEVIMYGAVRGIRGGSFSNHTSGGSLHANYRTNSYSFIPT